MHSLSPSSPPRPPLNGLDALDRKILGGLDAHGRIAISELARSVKHGRDIVDYRVRRLFDTGVVTAASVVLNPARLGLTIYKTYLRLRNQPQRIKSLVNSIRSHPMAYCVAETDGAFDLIFNLLAASAGAFDRACEDLLGPFQDLILDQEFAIILRHHLFPRKYLGTSSRGEWVIGDESATIDASPLDLAVAGCLSADARQSVVELAGHVGATPIMVRRRIERLERDGLIVGYRAEVNRRALGLTTFKAQLHLLPHARGERASLLAFARNHPEIVSFIHQLGGCRIEINIDTPDYDTCFRVIEEIKATFVRLVERVELLIVRNESYLWPGQMYRGTGRRRRRPAPHSGAL